MKIIQSKYEIIEQQFSDDLIRDLYKHIELCGRTCYKSNDKITTDSYKNFVNNIIKSKHGSMLEHATVYLWMEYGRNRNESDRIEKYLTNPYTKYRNIYNNYFITTNYRVMVENGWLDDLEYMCRPTEHHEKRYTVRFTCDIGVSREFNRHRKDSIAEESTRYCNYSKEKFGKELNIIEPIWFTDNEKEIIHNEKEHMSFQEMCALISRGTDFPAMEQVDYWLFANLAIEYSYMNLIRLGWKPQQARVVLPLDTKTELIHTSFASDWINFFKLRALGTTGAPHPSAKELAEPLMNEFIKRNYIGIRRIVYRKIQNSTSEENKYEYTNQIYEDGEWKYFNTFIGKFGSTPVIWYESKDIAEKSAPNYINIDEDFEINE